MKKIKKLLVVFMALVCVATLTGFALAASGAVDISVTFRDIKINIAGVEHGMYDAYGISAEPFIYNDTVYVPVRSFSEALGNRAVWDDETNTVYIGTPLPGDTITFEAIP